MNQCPNCSAELADHHDHCTSCGFLLTGEHEPPPASEAVDPLRASRLASTTVKSDDSASSPEVVFRPHTQCARCGGVLQSGAAMCSYCGEQTIAPSVWPPVTSAPRTPALIGPILTFGSQSDLIVGFVGTLALFIGSIWTFAMSQFLNPLVALAVVTAAYYFFRPRYPYFARGIGFCIMTVGLLIMAPLVICAGAIYLPGVLRGMH